MRELKYKYVYMSDWRITYCWGYMEICIQIVYCVCTWCWLTSPDGKNKRQSNRACHARFILLPTIVWRTTLIAVWKPKKSLKGFRRTKKKLIANFHIVGDGIHNNRTSNLILPFHFLLALFSKKKHSLYWHFSVL
jgi:hypothetical protein